LFKYPFWIFSFPNISFEVLKMSDLHLFYTDKEHECCVFDSLNDLNDYKNEWLSKNPGAAYECQYIRGKLNKSPPEDTLKVWFVYSEDDFGGDEKIKIFYNKEDAKKYRLEWIAKAGGKIDVCVDCRNVQSDYSLDDELIAKFMKGSLNKN
jgi:hypothetical protein